MHDGYILIIWQTVSSQHANPRTAYGRLVVYVPINGILLRLLEVLLDEVFSEGGDDISENHCRSFNLDISRAKRDRKIFPT